jgi:perosamine synthetase
MNKIKLFDPSIDYKEKNTIIKVLESKFWASGSGIQNVEKFEKKFSKYVCSPVSVAVNSGTAALHLALSLFNIKNKEVILPSLSFVSTAHAVKYNGGIPIFADIDPNTLCIDTNSIEEKISKRTALILPVHFGGYPAELDKIAKICKKNKLNLVEDAAHAVGTRFKNKMIGTHGDAVCFSFHPVKNLAMPAGGVITLNRNMKKFEKELKERRWCGISNRNFFEYDVNQIGWNYYMNEFSAAIGIVQLAKLEKLNHKRKNIAKRYFHELKSENKMPFDNFCSYHLYWIRVKNRTKFIKNMLEKKIEVGIHYKPIDKMSMYSNKKVNPITEKISKEIVSIPIHPNLTNDNINYIIKTINKLIK